MPIFVVSQQDYEHVTLLLLFMTIIAFLWSSAGEVKSVTDSGFGFTEGLRTVDPLRRSLTQHLTQTSDF
jgi:hypothetical protein